MFGFLKKKLQDAVSKFSKDAEADVQEEEVKDQQLVERALQEERQLQQKIKEPVKEIPELPAEKAQHEREKGFLSSIFGKKAEAVKPVAPETKQEILKPAKPVKGVKAEPKPAPKAESIRKVEPVEAEKTPEPAISKPITVKEIIAEPETPIAETKAAVKPAPRTEPKRPEPIVPAKPPAPEPPSKHTPEPAKPELKVQPKLEPVATPAPEKPAVLAPAPKATPVSEEPKRGFFSKLKETFTKKTLSEEKFDELFWELEVALLENNVAVEVIEKLKADLKAELTSGKVSRLGVEELVLLSLRNSINDVLDIPGFDLVGRIQKSKKPFVIAFIGVNGSGKTTTLAKVANLFLTEELSVVMAASDTFRAAAIDQLKEHADKLGVKLISQGYGADPAAVAFDAIEHAKAKNLDVVMIDTAGRLHSNTNLMAELQKVIRVAKPDLKIFIGESITGNDCVEQAKEFDRLVGIDAIILSKADVDEKGGAALSVSYVTKKPILYLGVGQAYGDLKEFDKEQILKNLGF